jgi:benzoylformate decarboxylase
MARTGRDVLLDVLRTEGVRHVFGNPGSTELPLIDALASADDISYVLALQEATAVGMADGYAQATGRPAFLNLHTSAGLGNAIGNLTNAQQQNSPLVVTAGQQHYGHIEADPLLSGDLVGIARSVSKWTHEIRTLRELGTYLRRAFHDAASAPRGPVFLSLPMSTLDEDGAPEPPAPTPIERATTAGALDDVADLLTSVPVGSVAIVVGDEVAQSGGVTAMIEVAEILGAPVYPTPLHGLGVFPPAHPLFQGQLALAANQIRAALSPYRIVFLVGGKAFMTYQYTDGSPVPDGTDLVHLSPDVTQLGRAHPARLALLGDPKATLTALAPRLRAKVDTAAASDALAAATTKRRQSIEELEANALGRYSSAPMDPAAVSHALVRAMPTGTALVDEAITTGAYVNGYHHWTEPGRYFRGKGGGLGWGMPAACGVSLAYDREVPVLCVVGDGSAMYSPQALWTAAHDDLPVVFAVVNNRQYLILKGWLNNMKGDSVRTGRFVAMDLVDPVVDYVGLARSMGVDATYVDSAGDIGDAVKAALAGGRPHLLELPIAVPA